MAVPPKAEKGLSALLIRTGTAALIGAAFLAAILFGKTMGLAVLISMVATFAVAEFFAMSRRERRLPNELFGWAAVAAMPFSAAAFGAFGLTAVVSILVIASLLWHLLFRQVRTTDTAITVFGAVYVGFTLSHFVLIRQLDAGTVLALATIFSVWANDVFAYLVGSAVGRHKMAPRISPNKSWEGFVAGTVFTVGVWVAVYFLATTGLSLGSHITVGVAVSLAAVVGDLAESRLKREAGLKDSGTGLPGHGGFLDRFDSLTLVSIVTYYMLLIGGATVGGPL
ncbi:MAG: phosphatidate cytidylyltransferase [Coriobacteriia bacterium]|nr:phosphatidate cytidylyltransferase [Coriobacteriia bacterium]MBN2822782.1 phosphatidate cytidylyltransferase [Coriobacteriia bacterium]